MRQRAHATARATSLPPTRPRAPQVQRRLRACLEASLPLDALPAAAGEAARAVEEAQYDEAVPVRPAALCCCCAAPRCAGRLDEQSEARCTSEARVFTCLRIRPAPRAVALRCSACPRAAGGMCGTVVTPCCAPSAPSRSPCWPACSSRCPAASTPRWGWRGSRRRRSAAATAAAAARSRRQTAAQTSRRSTGCRCGLWGCAAGLQNTLPPSWHRHPARASRCACLLACDATALLLARPFPPPQELLARARRRGWRINLRPLADVRNLAWIPIAYLLLSYGLRFLLWLVLAIASGPAAGEGGGGGGGDGAQRQHYSHHQHY